MGLNIFRIIVYEYILDDSVFSDLSPGHISSVLKLPQQGKLRSLVIHHRRKSSDLARLILHKESPYILACEYLLLFLLLTFAFCRLLIS
jgi:hypothetical protein